MGEEIEQLGKYANRIGWTLFLFYLIIMLLIRNITLYWGQIIFYPLLAITMILSAKYLFNMEIKEIFIHKESKNKNFTTLDKFFVTGLILSTMTTISVIILMITAPSISNNTTEISNVEIFLGIILGPAIEEIVFRGVLWSRLKYYGTEFAVIVTTILFTLIHGQGTPLIIIVLSIAAGILMSISNNVIYPIILHMVHNSGVLLWADSITGLPLNYKYTLIINIILIIVFFVLSNYRINLLKKIKNLKYSLKDIYNNIKDDKILYQTFFKTTGTLLFILYFGVNFILSLLQ